MKLLVYFVGIAVILAAICFGTAAQASPESKYVCPMYCQEPAQEAGTCAICGMELVEQAKFEKEDKRLKVAIVVFDGVQIIDYTAPYEVFGQGPFNVFTVAPKKGTVISTMGLSVNPRYTFADSPTPDVLVIPGGRIDRYQKDPAFIQWIREKAGSAKYVLSVCNGAFFLAKAGLLDGLSATTFHILIDDLAKEAPKTKVVSDKRFVDNGKIITSAGLSSGIDASLYVISKILGHGEAQRLALHLEYNWRPEVPFARASLADMPLHDIVMEHARNDMKWKLVKTQGDVQQWEMQWVVETAAPAAEVEQLLAIRLEQQKWKSVQSGRWTFSAMGANWNGESSVNPVKGENGHYLVTLKVQRLETRITEKVEG